MEDNSTHCEPISVACPEPYPKIEVCKKNLYYAKMLLPALTFSKSETSNIIAYIYQHWVLAEHYSELSDVLFHISKVEMHHLNIIGSLICKLGMAPKFCENKRNSWNSCMVNYTLNIRDMLLYNIRLEEDAVQFYKNTAYRINDCHVKEILLRIAADEELHVNIFKDFLRRC